MWLIVRRVIEMATAHANLLGIGYADLLPLGIGWVISRLSVEVISSPEINSEYTFTTWIESVNRHFSERLMVVTDATGCELMHVRTTWICIDFTQRTLSSLEVINPERFPLPGKQLPIQPMRKVRPLPSEARSMLYTFLYDDIDINGHVNTVQWIRLILNAFPLEWHKQYTIGRFDIAFQHECRYGEQVDVRTLTLDHSTQVEIIDPEGRRAVTASIAWNLIS